MQVEVVPEALPSFSLARTAAAGVSVGRAGSGRNGLRPGDETVGRRARHRRPPMSSSWSRVAAIARPVRRAPRGPAERSGLVAADHRPNGAGRRSSAHTHRSNRRAPRVRPTGFRRSIRISDRHATPVASPWMFRSHQLSQEQPDYRAVKRGRHRDQRSLRPVVEPTCRGVENGRLQYPPLAGHARLNPRQRVPTRRARPRHGRRRIGPSHHP